MGSKEHQAWERVKGRVGESITAFGGQNEMFRKLNRYFLSLSPPIESRDNDRAIITGRDEEPDLFVPWSFATIESATPQWLKMQFGNRPYVEAMGRTEDDQKSAQAHTHMLDYDFERANIVMKAIPYAKSIFKYGTGIGKVTYSYKWHMVKEKVQRKEPEGFDFLNRLMSRWVTKTEKRKVVDFDGPRFDWVSIFNFGVDPLYYTLQEMRYVWERRWADREKLALEDKVHKELTGKPLYKNLDKIPAMPKGYAEGQYRLDGSDDTSEAMGWTTIPGFGRSSYSQVRDAEMDRERAVEVVEYCEKPNNRRIFLANGETVILDGDMPYNDGDYHYVASTCIPLEGYFYGMGLLHPTRKIQEELNSFRMLNMKQARLNAMNVWAVPEDMDFPEQAQEVEPGDVVQVPFFASGKPGLVPLMTGRPLPPESQIYEDRMSSDWQRAIAFSDPVMGGQGGSGVDTATEAKQIQAGVAARMWLYGLIAEHTFLQDIAKKFVSRRQQYYNEDLTFRILGKEGPEYKQMTLEELQGEYDYKPLGQLSIHDKNVIRQQILQAVALTQNPMIAQISNVYEQMQEFWKYTDARFPERFLVAPPEKQFNPKHENIILNAGEYVPVQANEPHQMHIPQHMEGMSEVDPTNTRAIEAYQTHIGEHMNFTQAQGGAAQKPQEQPGLRGYQGNQQAGGRSPETEGGISARINAGPGVQSQ
jgi:hypothetical protein